ncbi:MAG: hypothetical protein NZ772_09025 [Cyanobacteria bacterium]|nr:hypothetical protein [Cyanobacteriota bacterium]MDW8199911.1 hypothetical protein [Cyanobacteriota bacterium SKYGB_h_bin112]
MNNLAQVKQVLRITTITALASTALWAQSDLVDAQAAYNGYVGVGAGFGFTEGASGEPAGTSVVIAGRQKVGQLPVSVRGQVFIFSGTTAFVPTISYDLQVGSNSLVYLGGGVALTEGERPSPVGNRNAFVLQPGIDIGLGDSNTLIFINGVYAFNAYKGNNGNAFSLQGGVGLQF